ncbi:hypothetical protein Nepgr_001429 [Nepenthes gracilis]|uniref:VQ domain-containing protein n=1 Tax=Nepenthes gracilis TaxID=150966 RepID=A0AAD3P610_NEPGR|nr:hypothetical protein Nepgr_001429 [Nepenthes gracilis]
MDGKRSEKIDQQKNEGSSRATMRKEPLRVKYISSPIIVNASSETEFRAVVQELTGKNSCNGSPSGFPASRASAAEGSRVHGPGTPVMDSGSSFIDNEWSRVLDDYMS